MKIFSLLQQPFLLRYRLLVVVVLLLGSLLPSALQAQSGDNGAVRAADSDAAWHGQYWSNRSLSGAPTLERDDAELHFDWGANSPDPSLPADRFSVRWTRYLYLEAGTYLFRMTSDDGMRVYINDKLLISKWYDHGVRTWTASRSLPAGHHLLRVEYYENSGTALAQLSWERSNGNAPAIGVNNGWRAEYFNNRDLSGAPAFVRGDANINFNWGNGTPANGVNSDNFSVRWTRTLGFGAGSYRFRLTVDDGVRLAVNNVKIIDAWREQGAAVYEADIYLPSGQIPLAVEYFEESGQALIKLEWQLVKPGSGSVAPPVVVQPTATPSVPGYSGRGAPAIDTQPFAADWVAEYFNNDALSGSPVVTRNESTIDNNWGSGSPAPGVNVDNFSVRWTGSLRLSGGRYRFESETDDGVRLYIDDRLVIDQWRTQDATRYGADIDLAEGSHTIRLEYFDRNGDAVARLFFAQLGATIGNIVTCAPPQPKNNAWIKLYRLDGEGKWYSIGKGIGPINANGYLKIDGLPVDVGRFGWDGEPYRVELWVNGSVVRSTGNYQAGEPVFRLRPFVDNSTPWGCAR